MAVRRRPCHHGRSATPLYSALTKTEIDKLLKDFLARNRGPGYGISVTDVAGDLSRIDATVTFVAGRLYCCAEPFCHLPLDAAKFIRFAAVRGFPFPNTLTINWRVVVEAGALLECNRAFGLPLATTRCERYASSVVRPSE